eukprot:scpid17102/ scgid30794/ Transcription elongation factor SPT6; Protein pandora
MSDSESEASSPGSAEAEESHEQNAADSESSDDEIIGQRPEKRRHVESLDEDLDDDDYDLIQSNTGINWKKRKNVRRAHFADSDEEAGSGSDKPDESDNNEVDEKEDIANELFGDDDDEEEEDEDASQKASKPAPGFTIGDLEASSDEDEDELGDFIVDEDDQPVKRAKGRDGGVRDHKLMEAESIFGLEFDPAEFDQYASDADDGAEEEDEDEPEEGSDSDMSFIDGSAPRERTKPRRSTGKTKRKAGGSGRSIYDVYEPSELERSHLTDKDAVIRLTDVPERFQLRTGLPVQPLSGGGDDGGEDDGAVDRELNEEAAWIFAKALSMKTVSAQDPGVDGTGAPNAYDLYQSHRTKRKSEDAVPRIREVIHLIRKDMFEVPFIAQYRKEFYEPQLSVDDLWKIYEFDEKWCQLQKRKRNLLHLFENTQHYQFEVARRDERLLENVQTIETEDLSRVNGVLSTEELKDVYQHFMLHHNREVVEMQNERTAHHRGENDHPDPDKNSGLKRAQKRTFYTVCRDAGLSGLADRFGLTPAQLGSNMVNSYQRYEVQQCTVEPNEIAAEYTGGAFPDVESALRGVSHMVATEIAHDPQVRQATRDAYYSKAKLTVRPTKKGRKEIEDMTPLSGLSYITNKPVVTLKGDQYLHIHKGIQDGLITLKLTMDQADNTSGGNQSYINEIRHLYWKDEYSTVAQNWNALRYETLRVALEKFLYPMFEQELKLVLLKEAQDHVVQQCALQLRAWVEVAPFQPEAAVNDDDPSYSPGLRVLTTCIVPDRSKPITFAMLDGNGEVSDFLRVGHLLDRNEAKKEKDCDSLKKFILRCRPLAIAIDASCREALSLSDTIKACVTQLEQEHQMVTIATEFVDCELARLYETSKRAEVHHREYNELLRHAISVGRRLQDPLSEFCYLAADDDEFLCLKLNVFQNDVPREDLLWALQVELINRVNEVGVDINKSLKHTHWNPLLQFVGGLGPRKASDITKKSKGGRIENRSQLITSLQMGPKVFLNCAGFIRINTGDFEENASEYIDALDNSRIHPETYDWARKMAVDALEDEGDVVGDEGDPSAAVEEILEGPERLKDLDLDAFAVELERQGFGNRQTTLYDIRDELFGMFKERRLPYRGLGSEEKFRLLTGETKETLVEGKLVTGSVINITRRRPTREMLDQANPERAEDTGLWRCPFCLLDTFTDLSEVWSHFDDNSCAGQATGVRVRLDNGLTGFISMKHISDSHVRSPEDRVKVGMVIHCRILRVNFERFSVELTTRSSDLSNKDGQFNGPRDTYYDEAAADAEKAKERKAVKPKNTYVDRVIVHPSFHNISFKQAEKKLEQMEQGDAIIRPSSKGSDHLTISWKVDEGVYHHIDVLERDKTHHFTLGKSLWIENEEFEDLDEILARHIQPMASFARDIQTYKYFCKHFGNKQAIDPLLLAEKRQQKSRIPYLFSTSPEFPGKFVLSYMPRSKGIHEYATVTPNGLRYRSKVHASLEAMLAYFKRHYKDPVPGAAQLQRHQIHQQQQQQHHHQCKQQQQHHHQCKQQQQH